MVKYLELLAKDMEAHPWMTGMVFWGGLAGLAWVLITIEDWHALHCRW